MFVLGAGADVVYGIPTVANLMHELAIFVKGDGAPVDKTLRKKLPHLRFTFDRYAGGQGDTLVSQLFTEADDLVPVLSGLAQKLKTDETMAPLGEVIDHLCTMASNNQLTGTSLKALAQFAGEQGQVGEAETIIDPNKISLSHIPATALRTAFQQALVRSQDYTEREREVLELFIVSTSNIEQLLSHYFTLYSLGKQSDQKTFLYLAWILWAYLRHKSLGRGARSKSIYSRLPSLGGDVITFNYTNFFVGNMAGRVKYFHGRLDRYLRVDDRTTVSDDPKLRGASTNEKIVSFLDGIRLNVAESPQIDIPAIVPPITFKPVMSREQLHTWAEADAILQQAQQIVIVGYSFATADEHFNDLLRKTNPSTRVLVVNPDLSTVLPMACRILDVDPESLTAKQHDGLEMRYSQRVSGVNAKAENLDSDLLSEIWP